MMLIAEILPKAMPFWEYGTPPDGMAAAALFFLLLLCIGIAADVGLALYWIKKPVRMPELAGRLACRALPGQLVLIFSGVMAGCYLLASWIYLLMFPTGGIGPHTVIFQTLLFHLPVLGLLGLLLHLAKVQGRELFGLHWKGAPALLGLSIVFYLAALPLLWFYSMLYQVFLHRLGRSWLV